MSRRVVILTVGFCALCIVAVSRAAVELVPASTLYDGGRQDVCLIGDTLYVASATGLEVFAIADSGKFRRIAQVIRSDGGMHVAVAERHVALATYRDSVLIFERTSAGGLLCVGAFAAHGGVAAVEALGNAFFVADSSGWWRVARSSVAPAEVDFSISTPHRVHAFAFRGDSLFAVQDDGNTVIYDVAGPPYPLDTIRLRPGVSSLVFFKRSACAAVGDSGVVIYSLEQSGDPAEVGRFFTYGSAVDLSLADTLLCVADSVRGLLVLTLDDPARPSLIAGNGQPQGMRAVAAQGRSAVGAAANGLFHFDVSDAPDVRLCGHQGGYYRVGDLAIAGNILAAAVDGAGLALMDIADPVRPIVLSQTSTSEPIRGLDLAGKVVALAVGEEGLLLMDVSDPNAPSLLFGQATIGSAREVALDDSLAIVADGGEGFRVFDVHDPAQAQLIGGKSTSAAVTSVARRDDFVFAVGPELGLEVYDISFAFKPRRVYAFHPTGRSRSVTLADRRAFLAVDSTGIFVFDISQPSTPKFRERLNVVGHPREVAVDGGMLLVVDDSLGVAAIDYRAVAAARVMATVGFHSPPVSMAYVGDVVYVSGEPYLYSLSILPPVVPGDADGSGATSLSDVVYLVNHLFRQGPLPLRSSAVDMDKDGRLNLTDLVRLIGVVFR